MSTTEAQTTGRARLTIDEFARIQDAGVFGHRHVQLLDGELYEVTKNPPHNFAVSALADALRSLLPRDTYSIREGKAIEPWEDWWPEPDIVVVRGPHRRFEDRHPGLDDLALVIEVADTSRQDWTKKLTGYTKAGFPVYWILDLTRRRLEVYREPGSSGYTVQEVFPEGKAANLLIDGQSFGTIAVSNVLSRT